MGVERLGNGSVIPVEIADERVGVRPTAKIDELVLPVDCAAQLLDVLLVLLVLLVHERLEPVTIDPAARAAD